MGVDGTSSVVLVPFVASVSTPVGVVMVTTGLVVSGVAVSSVPTLVNSVLRVPAVTCQVDWDGADVVVLYVDVVEVADVMGKPSSIIFIHVLKEEFQWIILVVNIVLKIGVVLILYIITI